MTLTTHPLLVPWSGKSRAIPLLPLWAVRSVKSLSVCTRVYTHTHVSHAWMGNLFITLSDKNRLRVFENRALRMIFGRERDEVTGEWKR